MINSPLSTIWPSSALAVGAMLALGLAAGVSVSGTGVLAGGDSQKQQSCSVLERQFKDAIEQNADSPKIAEARALGEDGIRRCRGGAYGFGVALLSEAIEKLGQVPEAK